VELVTNSPGQGVVSMLKKRFTECQRIKSVAVLSQMKALKADFFRSFLAEDKILI